MVEPAASGRWTYTQRSCSATPNACVIRATARNAAKLAAAPARSGQAPAAMPAANAGRIVRYGTGRVRVKRIEATPSRTAHRGRESCVPRIIATSARVHHTSANMSVRSLAAAARLSGSSSPMTLSTAAAHGRPNDASSQDKQMAKAAYEIAETMNNARTPAAGYSTAATAEYRMRLEKIAER